MFKALYLTIKWCKAHELPNLGLSRVWWKSKHIRVWFAIFFRLFYSIFHIYLKFWPLCTNLLTRYVFMLSGFWQVATMKAMDEEEVSIIRERLLRANTKDYGRYDPSPTFSKPPFKLIPNWIITFKDESLQVGTGNISTI